MKKSLRFFLILTLVFVALSSFFLNSPLMDGAASFIATRKLGMPVILNKVKLVSWSVVSFSSMALGPEGDDPWVRSGEGSLLFRRGVIVSLKSISFDQTIKQKTGFLSPALDLLEQKSFFVEEAQLRISQKKNDLSIHVLRCFSKDLILKGGLKLTDGHLAKGHMLIYVPRDVWGRLPRQIASRLKISAQGWGGIRLLFVDKKIALWGAAGPLFEARWNY